VKWTKNGEDFSSEPQITVLLDESADFVAVFQEDPDWQNPVMNIVGEYMCDRAHGQIECFGYDEAWITIDWGGSAWELTRWIIVGRLDTETMTIHYSGSSKANLVYDESGEVKSEDTVYADGTGTIVFNADGSFTWHEDQSETGTDLVFAVGAPEPAPRGHNNHRRGRRKACRVVLHKVNRMAPLSASFPKGVQGRVQGDLHHVRKAVLPLLGGQLHSGEDMIGDG
jgi:hypothetical protein